MAASGPKTAFHNRPNSRSYPLFLNWRDRARSGNKFAMARENYVISLKECLRSTHIDFLQLGTPLLKIAETLGPPKAWSEKVHDDQLVPLYWFYSGGLELSFEPEPPYPLGRFKLSDVGAHRGRVTRFSHHVRMRNDFPMIGTTTSGFLRSGLWPLDDVRVGICTNALHPALDICIGRLRIPFLLSADKEDTLEKQLLGSGDNLKTRTGLLDPNCDFFGAYFSVETPEDDRFPRIGWTTISARQYLSYLE
jgi:hypothetical protein